MQRGIWADGASGRVTLDYVSPDGPQVTHVRGTVVTRGLENLKQAALYDRYVSVLQGPQRELILYGVAASWLPMEAVLAHYHACDLLELREREIEQLGTQMATRLAETFLSGALRRTRDLGIEGFRWAVAKLPVFSSRLYKGGAGTVIELGPKDLIYEVHGYPQAESRYFRSSYAAYAKAIAGMFCKAAFVKPVRARVPHPHCIAIGISWV